MHLPVLTTVILVQDEHPYRNGMFNEGATTFRPFKYDLVSESYYVDDSS